MHGHWFLLIHCYQFLYISYKLKHCQCKSPIVTLKCIINSYKQFILHIFQNKTPATKVRLLCASPKTASKTRKFVTRIVRREVKAANDIRCSNMLRRPSAKESRSSYSKFSWNMVRRQAMARTPLLWTLLEAASGKGMRKAPLQRVGMAYALLMFAYNTNLNSLQMKIGVQLWLAGAKRGVFDQLNALGLSTSQWTVRRHLDEMTKGHDDEVRTWQNDVQATLSKPQALKSRKSLFTPTGNVISDANFLLTESVSSIFQIINECCE